MFIDLFVEVLPLWSLVGTVYPLKSLSDHLILLLLFDISEVFVTAESWEVCAVDLVRYGLLIALEEMISSLPWQSLVSN